MGMKLPPELERKILDTVRADPPVVPPAKQKPTLRGKLCQSIHLTLPWPPSLNNCYPTSGGKRVPSKRLKQYASEVAFCCAQTNCGHVSGSLSVYIWAKPQDRRRRDIDNIVKPILDSLQKAGVFADDS